MRLLLKMSLLIAFSLQLLLSYAQTGSTKNSTPANQSQVEKGYIKGRVTDDKGQPIANLKITAEHTVYYASYRFGTTNKEGYYKIAIPNDGSYKISTTITKPFEGINYEFDLQPDNPNPINTRTGGICNLTWKTSGTDYGAQIKVYGWLVTNPDNPNDMPFDPTALERVELRIISGNTITGGEVPAEFKVFKKVNDLAGDWGINGLPIGKYVVEARLKKENGSYIPLIIKLRNTSNSDLPFVTRLPIVFKEKISVRTYGVSLYVDEP